MQAKAAVLFYGRQPDVKHMVAFGAPCRVLLVGPERDAVGKLGVPSVRGCVIGYGGDGVQIGGSVRLILGYVVERPLVERGHTPFRATSAHDGDDQQQQRSAQQAAQQHAKQPAAARQPAVAFADEMRLEHDPERKDRASASKTAAKRDAGYALAAVSGEGGVSNKVVHDDVMTTTRRHRHVVMTIHRRNAS
jgi:pyruvate/2-oxoglutarate dehydrogenase complex dihydrolipoamide acyltransferase (E2) component